MKFGLDIKNKKAEFDTDAEKLIEKGMDMHDKNWKDKFTMKHNAKKEMLELKHQQKLANKSNKYEELRKIKELELEENRIKLQEEKKKTRAKIIASCVLGVLGTILFILGSLKGSASGDPNSGWHEIGLLGFFFYLAIAYIWLFSLTQNKK